MSVLTTCSLYVLMWFMSRVVPPNALALHLEVSLACASNAALSDLQHVDRFRKHAALATLARHLAQRLSGFEIKSVDPMPIDHPSLF